MKLYDLPDDLSKLTENFVVIEIHLEYFHSVINKMDQAGYRLLSWRTIGESSSDVVAVFDRVKRVTTAGQTRPS